MQPGVEKVQALYSMSRRRRLLVDITLLVCGIIGLIGIYHLSGDPRVRQALWLLVAWQGAWYTLRLVLMVGIWRREPALSSGRKVWLGLTMPIGGIAAIWAGRGALSAWLESTEENAS